MIASTTTQLFTQRNLPQNRIIILITLASAAASDRAQDEAVVLIEGFEDLLVMVSQLLSG